MSLDEFNKFFYTIKVLKSQVLFKFGVYTDLGPHCTTVIQRGRTKGYKTETRVGPRDDYLLYQGPSGSDDTRIFS